MTYPLNEEAFTQAWLNALGKCDEGDRELAEALACVINKAYYAGLEDGREEAAKCR